MGKAVEGSWAPLGMGDMIVGDIVPVQIVHQSGSGIQSGSKGKLRARETEYEVSHLSCMWLFVPTLV